MKKIILTCLLMIMIVPQLFAATGTVNLIYTNGTVSYTDTQTFYEFDVQAYVSGGSTPIFRDGMVYVKHDSTIFGTFLDDSSKVTITLLGALAAQPLGFPIYTATTAQTRSNVFAVTFEGIFADAYPEYYTSATEISTSSGSPTNLMRIKMEVAASGTSTVEFPGEAGDPDPNTYFELDDNSQYEGVVITGATETTAIVYSNTGDPATPITLKSFIAQYDDSQVDLTWITESETENAGFIIKRAIQYSDQDMSDYDVIASYWDDTALQGAGTTVEHHEYFYGDTDVKPGITYSYILEDVDYAGHVTSHGPVTVIIPENLLVVNEDYKLGANYPNPFNPSFTIPFELNKALNVNIRMYDITGKQVMTIAEGLFEARQYQIRVNASDLQSGIYFIRTMIGDQVHTQKMTLLK